ncbi:hypothetical protein Syun_009894 [Stephania yunnanensis]|uniref:Uncharacterized protein n=1 Tax=Stephania yunnanensis TaxID=152371 RepID=A0AAP0PR99_9MAGN
MQQQQSLFLGWSAEKFNKNKEEWRPSTRGIKIDRSNPKVHHLGIKTHSLLT